MHIDGVKAPMHDDNGLFGFGVNLMSVDLSRRTVLEGAAAALLLSIAGTAIVHPEPASDPKVTAGTRRRLLTLTYPAGPSIRFDVNYYVDHHVKLFMDIYGSAIERFELRKVAPSQAGAFTVLMNVWIADFDAFRARSTPAAYQRMGDDKKNFTNASSSIQVDEVTHEAGEPRANILRGYGCLSLLYPAGEAGAWGDEAQCRGFVADSTKLLGPKVLRRIEIRKGIEQLDDDSPTYQGGINLYSHDAETLSRLWQRHHDAAMQLSAKLCKERPLELNTTVFGIDSAHHQS